MNGAERQWLSQVIIDNYPISNDDFTLTPDRRRNDTLPKMDNGT
jgi:hypothetical protein